MKSSRPPIKVSDDDSTRLLLLEDWYEIFEPIYRYASDTAMDPAFDVIKKELKKSSKEIIEYIDYGGETALMMIGVVVSLVVTLARAGFSLGKFEYVSGQLGTSQLGQTKLGQGLEAREI